MAIQDNVNRAKAFTSGPFAELCSLLEFAEIHGVDESAIRHAIRIGRFRIGTDCMKFGKQWVMSKQAFQKFKGDLTKFSITYGKCQKAIAEAETEEVAGLCGDCKFCHKGNCIHTEIWWHDNQTEDGYCKLWEPEF